MGSGPGVTRAGGCEPECGSRQRRLEVGGWHVQVHSPQSVQVSLGAS